MILVGGLVTAATALAPAGARRDWLLRFGYRVLVFAALPGWILMRAGAAWTASREHLPDSLEPTWLTIGFVAAEGGGLLLLVALVAGGFGVRRLRPAAAPGS